MLFVGWFRGVVEKVGLALLFFLLACFVCGVCNVVYGSVEIPVVGECVVREVALEYGKFVECALEKCVVSCVVCSHSGEVVRHLFLK